MVRYSLQGSSVLCSILLSSGFPSAVGNFMTFSEGGDNKTVSIQDTVDAFRGKLGDPNNGNAPGLLNAGRREINWDGGGSATTVSGTRFDGFLNIRGAQFTTSGTGFVQAPPQGFDTQFNDPTFSETFGVFGPLRIFSPIGSNITDVSFFIPGTNGAQPATVSGFGAIFTDVDLYGSTSMQFYDAANKLIFDEYVPTAMGDKTFSFLGAVAAAGEEIFRVLITSGNTATGAAKDDPNKGVDLVAMDDFLYAEPKGVPETGGMGLMGLGVALILFCYRRFWAVA
jgi:hypothetical protein